MKTKKRRQRAASSDTVSLASVLKSTLLAAPIAIALGMLLLLGMTAILLTAKDPDRYHTAAGLVAIYLTALLGGTLTTRMHGRRAPLFCGLAMAFLMLLLLLVVSLILPESGHTYTNALHIGLHALLFPAAVVGALLGAREKKTPRRHRARQRAR